jgi:hypothetical protein
MNKLKEAVMNVSKESLIMIILTLFTIVLMIVTIIQTYRANRFERRAAEAEGTFKKANIEVRPYGKEDIKSFYLAFPLKENRVIEVPFVFLIRNNGEKTASQVELYLRMAKELHYNGEIDLDIKGGGLKNLKSEIVSETEYLHTLGFKFDNLLPRQGIKLSDKLSLTHPTCFESKVEATTKDSVDLEISYEVDYAYKIDFILMQQDYEPISKTFSVSVIDVSQMPINEYFDKRNRLALEDYKRQQKAKSFLKRLLFYLDPMHPDKKIETFYLIYCDGGEIQEGQKLPVDIVPEGSLVGYDGIQDITGRKIIPALGIR